MTTVKDVIQSLNTSEELAHFLLITLLDQQYPKMLDVSMGNVADKNGVIQKSTDANRLDRYMSMLVDWLNTDID